MPRKKTRRFLKAQLKLPYSRRSSRQPKITRNFIIFRILDENNMDVVAFRGAHSGSQARRYFYHDYQTQFPGERCPDVTAIEESAFHPSARGKIRPGTLYNDIPKTV